MAELRCVVQKYAWGKIGASGIVAQLQEAADESFRAASTDTYAELWMGTHPNGPSRVVRDGKEAELLSEWLEAHPEALGENEHELPYLFKVLSVQKALSIQAHPDMHLAQELHVKFPEIYKDSNHKPEMTIALTPFEALSQFRTISEIAHYLRSVPEFSALVDKNVVQQLIENQTEGALREFFLHFIYIETQVVATQISRLRLRLESQKAKGQHLSPVEKLVLRLNDEYGDDIGCFCPFILNYVTLQPGEAIFLGANEPHAYLSGDCIECMACSDNVVRAGLTPKFIDKVTLHQMLTYKTGPPKVFYGEKLDVVTCLYSPPVPEFEVESIKLAAHQSYSLRKTKGASILLIISGDGVASIQAAENPFTLSSGRVLCIPAGKDVIVECGANAICAYRASSNEHVNAAIDA